MERANRSGYSIVELLLVVGVFLTFLRLAVPNYVELRSRISDATSQRDFHRIKSLLRGDKAAPDRHPVFIMLNQKSPNPLPGPLSKAELSDGVVVHYAVHLNFPGFFDLSALKVSHVDGKHVFRLLEINDKGMEQIIKKE